MTTRPRTELDAYLALLKQIESDLGSGESLGGILQKCGLSREHFDALTNHFAYPSNSYESLTQSGMTSIVVPIFVARQNEDNVCQLASGVLLRFSSQSFLLTAAHVTDELNNGHLFIPGEREMIGVGDDFSYWKPSDGDSRSMDKVDLAYIRLSKRTRSRVHTSFRDVKLDELSFLNSVVTVPFATFVGYPVTKAKKRSGVHSSELVTYTGHLWTKDVYDKLKYSQERHICVRMRLQDVYSSLYERKMMPPSPRGISGGAILSWPRKLEDRTNNPNIQLVGIAHSFERAEKCLVGTHIKMYIHAILHNHPKLRSTVQRAINKEARLMRNPKTGRV